MANNESMFTSLDACNTKQIFVGDSTPLEVKGFGIIELANGQINDVFCVPDISTNLLSIYQITHSGEGKIVEFFPNSVVIRELKDQSQIVATSTVDHVARLYKFENFAPESPSHVLLAHTNNLSNLWHEQFGHLNYRYL